ncbi:MAG: hypothetical protein RLY43_2044 [Bacteroidota bacterium]|jgi:hypothetical protein
MEYLEVNRPNKLYCDGCPAVKQSWEGYWCSSTSEEIKCPREIGYFITPPNCPLKEMEDICNQKTLEKPKNFREAKTCLNCKHFEIAYLGNPYNERCLKYIEFTPDIPFMYKVCDEYKFVEDKEK